MPIDAAIGFARRQPGRYSNSYAGTHLPDEASETAMIRFACPSCKSVMETRDDRAGRKLACPKCRKAITVPSPRPMAIPVSAPMARPVAAPMAVPVPGRMAAPPATRSGLPMGKLLVLGGAFVLLLLAAAVYAIVQNVTGGSTEVATQPTRPIVAPPPPEEEIKQPSTPSLRNSDELIAGLSHKSMDIRTKAAQELSKTTRIDKSAAKPLAALLQEPGDGAGAVELRKLAARCLAKLGADAEPVVPQLTAALSDPNKEVRLYALDALGKVGKGGMGAVMDALRVKDPAVQVRAATILGSYGPDANSAVATLLSVMAEADRDRRVQIAVPLVKIDPAQTGVIKYLLDALNDSNDNTRRQAWVAVGIMGPNAKSAENQLFDAYNNEPNQEVKNVADDAYRKVTGQ
jgi:hypothetical protein